MSVRELRNWPSLISTPPIAVARTRKLRARRCQRTVPVRRGYQRVIHQRPSRMSKKNTWTIARRNHQEIRKKRRRRCILNTGKRRGAGGSTLVVVFVTVCTQVLYHPIARSKRSTSPSPGGAIIGPVAGYR